MNDFKHRPCRALLGILLCATLLSAAPLRADSDLLGDDPPVAADKSIALATQANALEADADKQCAKQPRHSRQNCQTQIAHAVQRLRAKAALAR